MSRLVREPADLQEMRGHPSQPETFSFKEWRVREGHVRIIKTHVAYDSEWPWWRRLWADLRGRP